MQHLERVKEQPNDDENQTQELMKDIKHNIRPTHILWKMECANLLKITKIDVLILMDAFATLFKEKNAPIGKKIILFFVKNLS